MLEVTSLALPDLVRYSMLSYYLSILEGSHYKDFIFFAELLLWYYAILFGLGGDYWRWFFSSYRGSGFYLPDRSLTKLSHSII